MNYYIDHHFRMDMFTYIFIMFYRHTLPIPGKLRKTCHTNLSLRRKLYKLHIVKKIEETTPRKHFFQRISNYVSLAYVFWKRIA